MDREDDYNIKYVLGLGDITQAYYTEYNDSKYGLVKTAITAEWANAKAALAVLDNAGVPYSLVRGNHDVSSYFNANFGKGTAYYNELAKPVADTETDEQGRPMAGFFNPDKIEDTYRKIIVGSHKYIIFTRGSYHMFQIFGTEETAHETKLVIENGTLKTVSAFSPIVFNNADTNTATDKIEIVLNGVTFDIEGATGGTRGPIVAFGDGVEKGVDANIILNDCTIYRGSSTAAATLFSLIDEKDGKVNNKTDVTVTVNGGTVVADSLANLSFADFSPAREGMASSADKVYLGEGSDGKMLTFKLPSGYAAPTALYELTDGNRALGLVSEDNGYKYYTLDPTGTVFGDVTAAYVSVESYPFALFYNGAFKCGYAEFNAAVAAAVGYIDTAAEAQTCGTVQIAMRRNVVCTGAPSFYRARGEIVVDLQGYKLSCDTTYLVSTYIDYATLQADGVTLGDKQVYASSVLGFDSILTFRNGDIRNDRTNFGMIGIDTKNSHSAEGYGRKSFVFNFDNVRFSAVSKPIVQAFGGKSGTGHDIEINVTDSTLDFTGAAAGTTMFLCGMSDAVFTFDIDFRNCSVIASKLDSYNMYTALADDTVTVSSSDGGTYLTVTQTSEGIPTAAFTASDGKPTAFSLVSSAEGSYVYKLLSNDGGDLGVIPPTHSSSTDYPIVIFKADSTFVGGYKTWAEAAAAAGLMGTEGSQVGGSDAVILFRDNYTQDASGGSISDFYNNVTIDLGGKTVTSVTQNFLYLYSGASLADASRGAQFGKITVTNGKLVISGTSNNVSAVRTDGNKNPTVDVTYSVTFDGVEFAVSGTKVRFLVASTAGITTGKSTLDIDCIDCKFDCTGGESRAMYLFASGNARVIDASVVGGEIIAGANGSFAVTYYVSPLDDTLKFERDGNGERTTLSLGSSVAAPTAEYSGLVFVKKSDDGTNTVYKLIPSAALNLNFVPKTSITLDSSLYLNVYVPENEYLMALTLDGTDYDLGTLTAENGYYRISIKLDSSEAARDIPMAAGFEANSETFTAKFTHSILKYAKKLLASDSAMAEEKTLVCDMLAYVKSAYAYFESADAETVGAEIDAIIDGYTLTAFEAVSGESDLTVPESVTFILDATPRIRFSFAEGTDLGAYTFKIGNSAVPYTQTARTDGGVTYVCAEISVFAYKMIQTVELYQGEQKLGGFHINSYYEFAKTQNDEKLVDVVERFYIYCKSAKAYRDAVIASADA